MLIGITIATAIVHLVSVGIGVGLGAALPTGWINLVAALAFMAFGFWTLRGDTLTDDEEEKVNRVGKRAVIAVGTAFFLAELGDKTMLATITLATDHGWFGTWLGSTLGHGRRGRARDRRRPGAGQAAAGEGHRLRRLDPVLPVRHLARHRGHRPAHLTRRGNFGCVPSLPGATVPPCHSVDALPRTHCRPPPGRSPAWR